MRKFLLLIVLSVLTLPSFVFADHEHRVTVLMRNGDRVSGLLEDIERGTVYVRVSQHDQRQLPLSSVALIDLVGGASGLPDTELRLVGTPTHRVFLRNGTNLSGTFVDVRGGEQGATPDEPHVLHFRTSGGEERRIGLNEVGRIYLGNFPGATTVEENPASTQPVPEGAIRVPGNAAWVTTPLFVRAGDVVTFNTTGRVQLSSDGNDVAGPAGSLRGRHADRAPLPQHLAGALIAKIGNSVPFPIGDQTSVRMPANGQLFLGINDDAVGDNAGAFNVSVSLQTTRRRR